MKTNTRKALLGTAVVGILAASLAAPTVAFAGHKKGHKAAKKNGCGGHGKHKGHSKDGCKHAEGTDKAATTTEGAATDSAAKPE